ncbi:translation initiation factor eIF [Salix suchowensis]|nr:translation initiation factor eIF [Salix suchowensis]
MSGFIHTLTESDLVSGNQEWEKHKHEVEPDFFRVQVAPSQAPTFLWFGCSDSRVAEATITGLGPGVIFVQRNIAKLVNVIQTSVARYSTYDSQFLPDDINALSVLAYAVDVLKVPHVVVVGHTDCGGARASLEAARREDFDPADRPVVTLPNKDPEAPLNRWLASQTLLAHSLQVSDKPHNHSDPLARLTEANVLLQIDNICNTETVKKAWAKRNSGHARTLESVSGYIYDIEAGKLLRIEVMGVQVLGENKKLGSCGVIPRDLFFYKVTLCRVHFASSAHTISETGHERSLTQIKFNREGDLLFTCSKDLVINVWFSHNGERLGTYDGHNGTVWTVDVDSESRFMVSGSADNMLKLWSVATGKCLHTWEFPTAVKRVAFSEDDRQVVCITEQRMGYQCAIRVFDINREDDGTIIHVQPHRLKSNSVAFTPMPSVIVTGHESGKIENNERAHMDVVTDLQLSKDGTYFITSSKDKTARIHDIKSLMVIKTFSTETPLNSAALAPNLPYVLLGGGQEAMSVTTTSLRQGKFETRFWHKVFEEEVGRVKGHFGPVNTYAQSLDSSGTSYASGGEDGFVRVHHFDESYFRAKPYGDLVIED